MRVLALALLLAGCDRAPPADDTPGGRLEAAAVARGLVADPERGPLHGAWARDSDRVCIVPGQERDRIGVLIDYGEGQGCAGSGTVRRTGEELRVELGDCRFDAAFDGERIAFPPALPAACGRLCTGRTSLVALTVERVSEAVSEAATLRAPEGRLLCGS